MDQEGAEALAEAASEAEASEAADLAVDLAVADTAVADLAVREVRISVGALARALAAGIIDRIITAAVVLAA